MKEISGYPENRLDIRINEQGRITYEQNAEFAKYYAPSREDMKEELEELQHQLELLEIDEPGDFYSIEHDDWEDEKRRLEEQIEDLEESIAEME